MLAGAIRFEVSSTQNAALGFNWRERTRELGVTTVLCAMADVLNMRTADIEVQQVGMRLQRELELNGSMVRTIKLFPQRNPNKSL